METDKNGNQVAAQGQVFVCGACGKQSKDKYGEQMIGRGWDVSCMLNAVLCKEDSLRYENGLVIKAEAV